MKEHKFDQEDLQVAVFVRDYELMEYLLGRGIVPMQKTILTAAFHNEFNVVKRLAECGGKLDFDSKEVKYCLKNIMSEEMEKYILDLFQDSENEQ